MKMTTKQIRIMLVTDDDVLIVQGMSHPHCIYNYCERGPTTPHFAAARVDRMIKCVATMDAMCCFAWLVNRNSYTP
jgi:hypothetical protein